MSRWNGSMGKGGKRRVQEQKRAEAEVRNALTLPERRRRFRIAGPTSRPSKKVRARLSEAVQ